MKRFLIFIILITAVISLIYPGPLKDPGIPDGEMVTYVLKIGNESFAVTEQTVHKKENGRDYYYITSLTKAEDMTVRIDRSAMTIVMSDSTIRKPGVVINNRSTTLRNDVKTAPDEISITDFRGLNMILRGYPFATLRTLRTKNIQGDMFAIQVNYLEETTLTIMGKKTPCYKLEMAVTGVLGAFVPKTYYWYTKEAPHIMVRYEGPSGGPGSPNRIMEMTGYSVKGQ